MSRHCSGLGSRVLGYHRVARGDRGRPRGYEREIRPGGDRGRKRGAGRGAAGRRVLTADDIVIATGGHPRLPAIPGAELGITSDGFFELASRPERVAVVGSSYIAIELSGIFSGLGADTALVLRGDTALKTL